MSEPTQNLSVVSEGLGRLTSMYAQQPTVRAILTAVLSVRQGLENVLFQVFSERRLRILVPGVGWTLPTSSVLDAIGALVGLPRGALDDVSYQGVLFLAVAANRSTGRTTDWSNFASILLQTAGGPAAYADGDLASFDFTVLDMAPGVPVAVASVLARAVPLGVRGNFVYSTWPPARNVTWGSFYSAGAGQGGFGSVSSPAAGGLAVAAQPLA